MRQRLRWIILVPGGGLLLASLLWMLAPLILPDATPTRSGSVRVPEGPSTTSPDALEPGGGMASIALPPLTERPTVYETNDGSTTSLAPTDALAMLQWPADLVEDPSRSEVTHVISVQNTQPASQPDPPEIQCTWTATFLVTIDVCIPIRLLIGANATMVRWVYQLLAPQAGFLWLTPTEAFTQEDSGLNQSWQVSQAIVLAFLAAVIAWSGLRYLMGSAVDWLSYATLVEILPRILLGLAVALLSKQIMLGLIGANNVLSGLFSQTSIDHLLKETQEPTRCATRRTASGESKGRGKETVIDTGEMVR